MLTKTKISVEQTHAQETGLGLIEPGNGHLTSLYKNYLDGQAHFDYMHCIMCLEEFI